MSKIFFPEPTEGKAFDRAVYRFMTRCGLRHLIACQKAGTLPLSTEALADVIRDRIMLEARSRVVSGYSGKPPGDRITLEWLERSSLTAAAFALEVFDPGFLAKASAGGKKHRPRIRRTFPFELLPFLDLSAQAAATKLGCSVATIYRLRAEIRKNPPRLHSEPPELLALLDP